tara:strand:+ start:6505 stop:6870 length:366 start_codon:yes stop_codon:yes gene_type:complete
MANNVKGLSNYLFFSDITTASTKTGSNDYTDVLIPTDTITGIMVRATGRTIDILFRSLHGDDDVDYVSLTATSATYTLPQICNELIKMIQAEGRKFIKVADKRNGLYILPEITNCSIVVAD